MRASIPVCFIALAAGAAGISAKEPAAADASGKKPEAAESAKPLEIPEPVTRERFVTIDGRKVPYKVTVGKIPLKTDDGKVRATVFHASYERSDVTDKSTRPVMFAFNGGPGSSAVWLHIGVLGPKIVKLPGDGTQAPEPPARVADNPMSILDVCDLVFVDPVSTGYSRAEHDTKPGEFHSLQSDIESVGDFVRRWVGEHDRWGSPKFLLGESYGGIRVAGLAEHLQSRYGMALNGVVLLSSLLDFATLQAAPGNDLSYAVFLPSFTGTAHFHGRLQGDRDELVRASEAFAFGEYSAALLQGSALDADERGRIAAKLESLTSIPAAVWIRGDLRLSASEFRTELLRDEAKVVGRFDGRVAWDTTDPAARVPGYDPSYALAYGAFSSAMLDYLGRDLGYKEDRPYEILTGKVMPWRWESENRVVNVSDRIAVAMRDNPHLRVLVMAGHTDLATPPAGVAYSLRHLPDMPHGALDRIHTTTYDGGHMFYLNPPDLEKTRRDLVGFLGGTAP